MTTDERQVVTFGVFALDLTASELSKQGRPVQLQHQPLALLKALLDRPGELVTREELRGRLWSDGITVDFDQSLNKCVTKLRSALNDSVASPRFIETLPKRGYRFIAPVYLQGRRSRVPGFRGSEVQRGTSASTLEPWNPGTPEPRNLGTPEPWNHAKGWMMLAAGGAVAAMLLVPTGAARSTEVTRPVVNTPANAGPAPIFAARDAYERGRLALSRRTDESLRVSVELFQRAAALSPRYPDAYVGLADAWSLLSSYGLVDPREGMPRAREAANRALMLDATTAHAHASLGRTAMIFDWDWPTAEWHFTRAIALEPGAATAHQWYAYLLSALARHDEAVAEARRAIAAEPRSLNTNTALGYVLYEARRYDEAATHLTRTLEIDPGFVQARRNLGLVRIQQGRLQEGIAALARVATLNQESPAAIGELAWAHGVAGDAEDASRLLAKLDTMRSTTYVPPDAVALAQMGVGHRDQAVAWLQRAFATRVAGLAQLATDPVWDPLRDDPRVKEMIAAVRGY